MEKDSPLAARLRPTALDEVVGQKHILGEDKLLYRAIKADKISSVIFYGPPGTGKTTIAKVIANTTSSVFKQINATVSGKKDMEEVVEEAKKTLGMYSKKTILFVDEIHRFNKAQQDYLLPFVEDGTIVLIGATTENPYFEVNKALISRSTVFQLYALSETEIKKIIESALQDKERGYGNKKIILEEQVLDFIADLANGDARIALNGLELAVLTTYPDQSGIITITLDIIKDSMQKRSPAFDKGGEAHYDTISAFIKSMRGSDPDATLFYLAKALYGGEDIEFLARRIVICAAEDVGLANPQMLSVAVSAYQAIKMIGMPEARIILAEAALAIATSPKSNSAYLGIDEALNTVKNQNTGDIPFALRNAPVEKMQDLGYSIDYKYAHDFPYHYANMQFLPDKIKDKVFYQSTNMGYEQKIQKWLDFLSKLDD